MTRNRLSRPRAGATLASIGVSMIFATAAAAQPVSVTPATMPGIGTVDERYQSYNVEMLEVTGGRFWRPYGPELDAALRQPAPAPSGSHTPAGMNPALYEYRPPIDLTNARLRKLAAALGPAYVRVSGTWANTTYFPDTDRASVDPPSGFGSVLTHQQWRGVVNFSKAVDAGIVTSFATGVGTRNAQGVWTAEQAKRFLAYTRSIGGRIVAAEWMNEPTLAAMGGAPAGYSAADYGRDFKILHAFARQSAPEMLILGPGSVGETADDRGVTSGSGSAGALKTRDMLVASMPAHVDAFSYHHYGAVSLRCAAQDHQTTPERALSEEWLRRTDETLAFYRTLRNEFEPGRPFWLTETADAACGGNPWANTFLDTFRYLDQLGRLAKQDVKVVAHNTLVASDYGLLNDKTLEPKPNYWGALLWRRLMGTTVLESGVPIQEGLHVYAHCLRGTPGGVALLAVNNSRTRPTSLTLPVEADRLTLKAQQLEASHVRLNGQELVLGADDKLPAVQAIHIPPGNVELAPESITFLAIAAARNGSCRS
jgi:glycosyl hydrolase family 79